jgi:hypothetical protein
MIEPIEIIEDLLTGFDEMGFVPTTTVPNSDAYAIEWKNKLTDALQELIKQREWISVDERLPEKTCECLIIDKLGIVFLAPYSDRHRSFNASDDDDGDRWKLNDVTHWMPLPEVPKGE